MKPTFLLLALSTATIANATVYTVSNEPGYPAQFTSVQAAQDSASAGDTLYITPSATNYGNLNVDRTITLIGAGYGNVGAHSQLSGINCKTGASGSQFYGLNITGNLYLTYAYSNNTDLLVERCRVGSFTLNGGTLDGFIVKRSVIGTISLSTSCTNILITNNLITQSITGSTSTSVLISNNVFTGTSYGYALQGIQFAVISNNIFYGTRPTYSGNDVLNCAFNNNLTYQTAADALPPAGNVGAGNMVGVDPLFVNVASLHQGSITYDYHLQTTSPGHNTGTDGTDIGLYGGGAPLNGSLDGVPRLPLVTQFNLLNSSINQGGSINVQVQGAKHD